jgi:peptidoglycan hydrolase-like protein with peptidoglycan-binding domain
MKMKTLTAIAITLIGALHAIAAPPTLLDRAKARDAKVAAAQAALNEAQAAAAATNPPGSVDPKLVAAVTKAQSEAVDIVAKLIGPEWREAWEASTLPDPDDILADRYMQTPFDLRPVWKFEASAIMQSITPLKRAALLDHIAAKPALSPQDIEVIRYAGMHRPGIAARMEDIAALLPTGSIRGEAYYQFRNVHVLCRTPSAQYWRNTMKVAEWIDLATQPAHFSTDTFKAGRNKIMLRIAQLLIEKRQAQGLPTEGEQFDAAFAPVVAALKAPKFTGLREIVGGLELPIELPNELDWSAQEAVGAVVVEAAERNGNFLTSWGESVSYEQGLGSVMFVKGETAYEQWRLATIAKD